MAIIVQIQRGQAEAGMPVPVHRAGVLRGQEPAVDQAVLQLLQERRLRGRRRQRGTEHLHERRGTTTKRGRVAGLGSLRIEPRFHREFAGRELAQEAEDGRCARHAHGHREFDQLDGRQGGNRRRNRR